VISIPRRRAKQIRVDPFFKRELDKIMEDFNCESMPETTRLVLSNPDILKKKKRKQSTNVFMGF